MAHVDPEAIAMWLLLAAGVYSGFGFLFGYMDPTHSFYGILLGMAGVVLNKLREHDSSGST